MSDTEYDGVSMDFSRIRSPSRDLFTEKEFFYKDSFISQKKKCMQFLIVDDNIFNIKSLEGILK